jgi:hypothetical protein
VVDRAAECGITFVTLDQSTSTMTYQFQNADELAVYLQRYATSDRGRTPLGIGSDIGYTVTKPVSKGPKKDRRPTLYHIHPLYIKALGKDNTEFRVEANGFEAYPDLENTYVKSTKKK